MIAYTINNAPNQRFIIKYGEESITINLRFCPAIGSWLAGIDGVCDSVRVVVNVPIFQQYGYNRLFFVQVDGGEVIRDISQTAIIIYDEIDLNDTDFPTVEVFASAVRLVKNG